MKYLTSKNAKLILGLLFTNPKKKYYLQELARMLGKKAGAIQKAANYLTNEKIVIDERKGNMRFFFINEHHPLYAEIRKIIFKTVGVEGTLRKALQKIKSIEFAFLYGSFAKDTSDAASDIDICIVGNVGMREVNVSISNLEKAFQREINYVLYSSEEFKRKFKLKDPFIRDILKNAIFLVGSNEDFIRNT